MSHSRVWSVFVVLATMAPAAGVDASQRQLFDLDVYRTVFGTVPTSADVSTECAKDLQTYLVSLEQNTPWTILSTCQNFILKKLQWDLWTLCHILEFRRSRKSLPYFGLKGALSCLQYFCSISLILRSESILCRGSYCVYHWVHLLLWNSRKWRDFP